MRVLIIGSSHTASVFTQCLAEDEENLVFTTTGTPECGNFVDIPSCDAYELKEFALANEMNLTIIADPELMSGDYVKLFSEADLAIFAPDPDAFKVISSRGHGKKFMYKNKIHTPKFAIFDKAQLAIEYARASSYPLIVKSDEYVASWPVATCKTFAKAVNAIEKLFNEGCKKVVMENFVEGREFTYYVLTDGYNVVPLDSVALYKGKYAYLDAIFVDDELDKKILDSAIKPTVNALEKYSTSYTGILGINFILTDRNVLYATEFKSFFNDLDAELFTLSVQDKWTELFNSAIVGSLTDDFPEIKKSPKCFISAYENGEYYTEEGITLNQAREKLEKFAGIKEVCDWKF